MPIVRRTARFNQHRNLIVSLFKHPPARRLLFRRLTAWRAAALCKYEMFVAAVVLIVAWGALAFGSVYSWAFAPLLIACALVGAAGSVHRPSSSGRPAAGGVPRRARSCRRGAARAFACRGASAGQPVNRCLPAGARSCLCARRRVSRAINRPEKTLLGLGFVGSLGSSLQGSCGR